MTIQDLNPYLRTTGKSGWYWFNNEPHVSYDQRVFAILENSAQLTFFDRHGKAVSHHILEAGDAVFFGAGTPYFFENNTSLPFRYICLSYDMTQTHSHITTPDPCRFSQYDMEKIADKPFFREGQQLDGHRFPLLFAKDPTTCTLCKQIWQENYCRRPYYKEKCSALLKEMLTDALRRNTAEEGDMTGSLPLATTILHYIDTRFQQPITIQDIADELHYHPYYISRVFTRVYGTTPYQYLVQCRVNKALSLLENLDMAVGEIAGQCGFVNVSHFSAAIKRETGKSPTQIRKEK